MSAAANLGALRGLLVALLLSACGGSSSSPTEPSDPDGPVRYFAALMIEGDDAQSGTLELNVAAAAVSTGVSALSTGVSALSTGVSALSAARSVSGTIKTTSGSVVPLSGTYENSVIAVTGGGYSITANVNGGTLTGTATAPAGQTASVLGAGGTAATASTAIAGTYTGTYTSEALLIYNNTRDYFSCMWKVNVIGSIKVKVTGTLDKFTAEWVDEWIEKEGIRMTCPFAFNGGPSMTWDDGYQGRDFIWQYVQDPSGPTRRYASFEGRFYPGEIFATITHRTTSQVPAPQPGPPGFISNSWTGGTAFVKLKKQ